MLMRYLGQLDITLNMLAIKGHLSSCCLQFNWPGWLILVSFFLIVFKFRSGRHSLYDQLCYDHLVIIHQVNSRTLAGLSSIYFYGYH
jgi:hypothetical protein